MYVLQYIMFTLSRIWWLLNIDFAVTYLGFFWANNPIFSEWQRKEPKRLSMAGRAGRKFLMFINLVLFQGFTSLLFVGITIESVF